MQKPRLLSVMALGCLGFVTANADGVVEWTSDAVISPVFGSGNYTSPNPIPDGIDSTYYDGYQGDIEYYAYRNFTVTTPGFFTLVATLDAGGFGGECSVDGLCSETDFQTSASTEVGGAGQVLEFAGEQSSTAPFASVGYQDEQSEVLYLSTGDYTLGQYFFSSLTSPELEDDESSDNFESELISGVVPEPQYTGLVLAMFMLLGVSVRKVVPFECYARIACQDARESDQHEDLENF
jgi:hypothetical protein